MERISQWLDSSSSSLSSERELMVCSSLDVRAGGQTVEQSWWMARDGPNLLLRRRKKKLASRATGQPM